MDITISLTDAQLASIAALGFEPTAFALEAVADHLLEYQYTRDEDIEDTEEEKEQDRKWVESFLS